MRFFVLGCVFFGGLGQGVVNPKLPEILIDHSHLALDSGISASLMYLGIFFASFFYGRVADKGKVFLLLAAGLFAYALVLVLFTLSSSKLEIFLLRFAEGLSLSAIYVAADVVLCRASAEHERGRWLSFYGVALSLGLLAGPVLLLIGEAMGVKNPLVDSLGFVAGAALALAFGSFFFRLPAAEEAPGKLDQPGAVFSASLYGFLEAGLVAVLSALVVKSYAARPENVFIVIILSAALASLGWGFLIDKWGGRKSLRAIFLLHFLILGSIAILQLIHPGEFLIYASAAAFGISAGGIYPAAFAWLVERAKPSAYGYASGLFTRAYGLGSLLGPLAFGLVAEGAGPFGFFAFASLLGVAGLFTSKKSASGVG